MENNDFTVKPIGIIRTPHKIPSETPVQPVFSQGTRGSVRLDPEYIDGLLDIDQFSHIILIYLFHRSKGAKLTLKPYLQDEVHGIFATRAPHRPNPIGFSVVKLNAVEKNILHIEDVDMLDQTPLLDIKPYIKRFDTRDNVRSGWQDDVRDHDAEIRGKRDYEG